jgi:hypothetical protein|tara:strand:- start:55 stop:483 length:429 start_codon:yes stop_codon:yes gene_type:complete
MADAARAAVLQVVPRRAGWLTLPLAGAEESWFRGVEALQVCAPGENERSWARLKELFAREDGSIHFDDLEGMLPVDPRVVSVLTIIVRAIASHGARFHRMMEAAASTAAANETAAAADAAGGAPSVLVRVRVRAWGRVRVSY